MNDTITIHKKTLKRGLLGLLILALIPVLTSQGRGADVMVPMALPIVGGMFLDLITVFVVPTIYCLEKEIEFERRKVAD